MITNFKDNNNNFNEKIKKCMDNIEEIRNLTPLLKVFTIEYKENIDESYQFIEELLYYENTFIINDYHNYMCPNCKNKDCLHYHKLYSRNIVLEIGKYLITGKIDIIVLECNHCKQVNDSQHYHSLLPSFLFPYHVYSKGIILHCLHDKIVKDNKISVIEEKYNISYQLLYYWFAIMKKYEMVSSIILKIPINIITIINSIIENEDRFLETFYQKYFHPYFLFKKTCVPLAITP